ncbi:hypothetical protein [Dyadobacter chenhuakuii]|uniref:Uncharacterized protein n=1 Tax=Dyadobacter chenhuakuii TaxID=2909339 RepID=A0A9X1TTM9_9BACT|nr:hypothetical protein [Dyadobacter chenhuakuii]MCF2500379.1 hypothetical protein [Dyadobacter chenhuakuii]
MLKNIYKIFKKRSINMASQANSKLTPEHQNLNRETTKLQLNQEEQEKKDKQYLKWRHNL